MCFHVQLGCAEDSMSESVTPGAINLNKSNNDCVQFVRPTPYLFTQLCEVMSTRNASSLA